MKIGIITFHRALNYGALLQAFALQEALAELNIESEIIDYRNNIIEEFYRFKGFKERKGIKNKVKYIIRRNTELHKRERFDQFRINKMNITKETYIINEELRKINDNYDFYITGSDQVWNYDAHSFDKTYFLDFVLNPKKRVSYAASFGITSIPEKYRNAYSALIKGISALSVREEEGKKIIQDICGISSEVVLDPIFLLTRNQWIEKVSVQKHLGKYILVYCFELSETMKNFIEKLSFETGLEVHYYGKVFRNPINAKFVSIENSDPFEFVRNFINAEYIVTNSFHGLAFSINLNKPFFVELLVKASKVNSRLENIIQLTGLESRYIKDVKDIKDYLNNNIDWKAVNKIMDEKRCESYTFIKRALNI